MRKTILTALVTLLVMLAVVSCDNLIKEQDGFVTLGINTDGIAGNSRSLADSLAKQEATYVEVIFKCGTTPTYYRADGYLGPKLKIKIPIDSYATGNTNSNDAIILVGRKSDGTLLATGKLTGNNEGSTEKTDLLVTANTTAVVFTLTSLTANLKATATLADNSFKITDASVTTAGFNGKTMAATKYDGAPCFQVPIETNDITATLTIGGLTDNGAKIKVNGDITKFATFESVGVMPAVTAGSNASTINKPISGDPLGAGGVITISFNTPTQAAFTAVTDASLIEAKYIITFAVPVVGYDSAISGGLIWLIRGGTKSGPDFVGSIPNQVDDGGGGTMPDPTFKPGPAEGVALLVTTSSTNYIEVDVETGP